MIHSNEQIVWTPELTPTSISIYLTSKFASACFQHVVHDVSKYSRQVRDYMGESKEWQSSWLVPFTDNRLLPQGFYKGRNGVWLTTNTDARAFKVPNGKPIVYHSHNADTALDREWFMKAFEAWVLVAEFQLKNMK